MQVAKQAKIDRGRAFHDPEAAEFLGLSAQTLPAWRSRGRGPRFHKVGRRVVYFESDLTAFLDSRATDPEGA
jgi:predicted DNA-binding transcriptional regulator AlpA